MFGNLSSWVTDVINTLGYGGVAFLVALENVFPPIPSEIILPFAGFVAGQGQASLPGMIVAATIGAVVGAWVLYGASAAIGPARLRVLVAHHGKWLRVTTADLDRTESWFDDHSGRAVLICRCVPLVRSLVSIPAGFRRMPFARFTLYTAIGSGVWNTVLVTAGFFIGDNWHIVEQYIDIFKWFVYAAVAIAIAVYIYKRFLKQAP